MKSYIYTLFFTGTTWEPMFTPHEHFASIKPNDVCSGFPRNAWGALTNMIVDNPQITKKLRKEASIGRYRFSEFSDSLQY